MGKCLVLFCKNRSDCVESKNISFYSVTRERYLAWMKAIGRNCDLEPRTYTNRICSEHFASDSFFYNGKDRILKKDAIPTLNLKRPPLKSCFHKDESKWNISKYQMSCGEIQAGPSTQENYGEGHICSVSAQEVTNAAADSPQEPEMSTIGCKRKLNSSTSDSEGLHGSPKRRRRCLKVFHNYSVSPRKLKDSYVDVVEEKHDVQQKLKTAVARVRRLKGKVNHLKDVLEDLSKKQMMTEDTLGVLEKSYSHIPLSLMKRVTANLKRGTPSKMKFPEEFKSFAMTLQFYSSKAYDHVRKTFHLALPASSVIRSWMSSIDCEPGFVSQAFDTLKMKVDENKSRSEETICALMLDERSIKKQIDYVGGKTWGYIDLGTNIEDDELKYASDALVLMVVCVNGHWKLAIGYFLISGISEKEKANVVTEAIKKLTEIEVTIISVTCDGPSAHFSMANELGASLNEALYIQPYFLNPLTESKIFIIFDACHLIKLLRNNWANLLIIVDGDGNKIDYNLIKKLFELQESELLRFGTKLRKAHLEWQKQKMKVNLAIQVLSKSVADALQFLMDDIKHSYFKNAAATIKFIRMADQIFDLCNSKNVFGKGCKTPLKIVNENYWRPIIQHAIKYLQDLKTVAGLPLHQSRHKTPVKGFIITLSALLGIFDEYVKKESSSLKYLLTYKMSQDHLELFFFNARSRYGSNNNPTAYQFHNTFRRLMLHHELQRGSAGNCVIQDDTSILQVPSTISKRQIDEISIDDMSYIRNCNLVEGNIPDHDYTDMCSSLTLLSENIVTYISGFIVRKLKKEIKCPTCILALEYISDGSNDDCNTDYLPYNRKNRGGLVKPSRDVITILKYVEVQLRLLLLQNSNKLPKRNNFFNTFCHVLSIRIIEENKCFLSLESHILDCATYDIPHRFKLIKKLIISYTTLRWQSIAKKQSQKEAR